VTAVGRVELAQPKLRVLVTGATGFVGNSLLTRLGADARYEVRGAARRLPPNGAFRPSIVVVGELGTSADWQTALAHVDMVVHTAALVHARSDHSQASMADYRRVNVEATLDLARQAIANGVRRFVFLSSVKVNGDSTEPSSPFGADDPPRPGDMYGISKHEAECGLRKLAAEASLEVVIIRPVLVYGPGVKANFLSMMRWIQAGIPLPLGALRNRRSFVAIDNLIDLITICLEHPKSANQTFMVSDGEDLSTPDLLRRMASAMHRPARLISIPEGAIRAAARLVGKDDIAGRLCSSLQVDIEKTRRTLSWSPPVSVNEGIRKTAEDYVRRELDQ
jgi:UDP-4-keto-D-QuiNAc 4-reductase